MRIPWWTRILDFVSPRLCVVCGRRLSPTERSLCAVCQLHLPRTAYQFMPDDNPMAQLFWYLAPIERAAALIYYEPHSEMAQMVYQLKYDNRPDSEMAQMVYQLKYDNRPDIGEDMGRVMGCDMQLAGFFDGVDVLLPVPLSRKRLRQRGYNQSEQLARGISDITHLPVVTKVLRRKHFRQSQTQLNRRERQENVADMFELRDGSMLEGSKAFRVFASVS